MSLLKASAPGDVVETTMKLGSTEVGRNGFPLPPSMALVVGLVEKDDFVDLVRR